MDGYDDNLTDAMGALSVNVDLCKELELDDNIRTQLMKIENDYESIFSWDIQRLIGVNVNPMLNHIDKLREHKERSFDIDGKADEFNLTRFYLQLVAIYELYNSKSYKESCLEIESVVKFMETCKFDESNAQYSDAYHHIARSTNAYIALTLNINSEKSLKDVKQINNFNEAEKSAICAVKSRVFMEYPPKGNSIALKFADQARILHSTEPEWIIIWLKAKGRERRYNEPFKMPGDDEIAATEMLCSTKTDSKFLIESSRLYKELGMTHKLYNNHKESTKYFKLSSDFAKMSIESSKDEIYQLKFLLTIENPNEFFSISIIENLITKLSNVKNSYVDHNLGLYYLKHEKDYVKAKIHFSRGMAAGHFGSSLQLIKVECLLQPVKEFPLVKTLNMMYEVFSSPKKRLIILSQILVYFFYCENNPKELMRYLKCYLDENIEDALKKSNLIIVRPLFDVNKYLRPNEFLNDLSEYIKELINNNTWNREEKKIIENTFDRFNKMIKSNILDIRFKDDNKTTVEKKNESWRKQRVDWSEIKSNEKRQQKIVSWRRQRDSET